MSLHCDICKEEIPDNQEYNTITIDRCIQNKGDIINRFYIIRYKLLEVCYRCADHYENILLKDISNSR